MGQLETSTWFVCFRVLSAVYYLGEGQKQSLVMLSCPPKWHRKGEGEGLRFQGSGKNIRCLGEQPRNVYFLLVCYMVCKLLNVSPDVPRS